MYENGTSATMKIDMAVNLFSVSRFVFEVIENPQDILVWGGICI